MTAIIFDLETTGFGPNAEIIQIAAKYHNQEFNVYIFPSNSIPTIVSNITNLSIEDGQLILDSENEYRRLDTESPRMACELFISFLKNISHDIILVAHNGERFDAPLIVKTMNAVGLLKEFGSIVKGFTDSLSIFKDRKELAFRKKKGKGGFSLSALANDYLEPDSTRGAHNAVVDVQMLDNLLKKFAIKETELISCVVPFSSIVNADRIRKEKEEKKNAMFVIMEPFGISKNMIKKIVTAGLTLDQLEMTFNDYGEDGITMLLGEDVDGNPRVTKNKTILRKLCNALRTRLG
ncbi:hypothetical protein EAG_09598 [Camponotus floridanus]|uniref:Exonuclease domain-containing protein n=1 Tax=Camponotus floridanus TaxID=104421 RepID=E2ARH6_CAMFO|nr:uncharacterized protein LOC112639016 [Camponotus floridanus]EFN63985.1 hypothetical protein EAG_09598 [Camponotus floridanus]